MKTLKPFQNTAVDFFASRKNCLLADSMGLGKTISAIGALNHFCPHKVLIVCPAAIKEQWAKAIEEEAIFWPNGIEIVVGQKAKIVGKSVVIVNYDLITCPEILCQLLKHQWSVGIYDEVHYCKSLDAKRTKAVFGKRGLVHNCVRNILLTGTPVLNRPIELYPMLKVLAPDVLGNENTFEKFGIRFCRGWFDGRELNVQGASNEEELNKRLVNSGFMLRRTEKDVELQLPPKRYQIFMVDGTATPLRELDDMDLKDFRRQRFETETPIATLRRELAELKTKKSLPMINDIVNQVDKLVIFAYHRNVIDKLMEAFGNSAVRIDGSCSQRERQVAMKLFSEVSSVKVLVGQLNAAGQGLDGMQNICNHILFLEISWTPAEIQQAIARVHRMGQTKSVLIQFIVWQKSVEEHQLRIALEKTQTITKIIGE